MIVGCPTEIKTRECRVGIIPASVYELVAAGHSVLVQGGAGVGSGITDDDFAAAGARIVPTAAEVWAAADVVCKVKEPLAITSGVPAVPPVTFAPSVIAWYSHVPGAVIV